ncbi:hypothetical protein H5410_010252 [Solanum commersonii]|uniref:Uncharacterized protein n=1 Tax=Solanum commersonii TaxID=4109 RepID=A0A9J6ALS0_SOLCO|nr:hypothetical protein H5410_010252 [Solanum commersonii]
MSKACDESFEYQISYRMKTLILASDAFKGMSELMFIPKLFIYNKKISNEKCMEDYGSSDEDIYIYIYIHLIKNLTIDSRMRRLILNGAFPQEIPARCMQALKALELFFMN